VRQSPVLSTRPGCASTERVRRVPITPARRDTARAGSAQGACSREH
jgi:hypothetical protein